MRRESKMDVAPMQEQQKQFALPPPLPPPPVPPSTQKPGGLLVFIPVQLSEAEVATIRETFFKIVTNQYVEPENGVALPR